MMVIRIDGQVYESSFMDLAQKFTPVFNEHGISINAIVVKGNITYLRIDQNTGTFGFNSKPRATIFGLPNNDWVNDVELREALSEAMCMEVNFV